MTQNDKPQNDEPESGESPKAAEPPADLPVTGEAPQDPTPSVTKLPYTLIVLVLVVAILAIGAVLTWPAWRHLLPPMQQQSSQPFEPRAAQETPAVSTDFAGLADLRAELESVRQRVAALEAQPAPDVQPSSESTDLAPLETRVDRIETAIRTLAERPQVPAGLSETLETLSAQTAELRRSAADSATVLRLADRVEQVEAQMRDILQQRGSAAGLLLAVGQLRAAVNDAMPFEAELRAVRALAPAGLDIAEQVEVLKQRAASGIPTRMVLTQRFDQLAADLVKADVLPQGQGWWRDTMARLSGLLVVRRESGEAAGEGTAAIVARTDARLAETDLAGAVAEAEALEGAASERAAPWLADAKARLAADKALSTLTAETLTALGQR